jgi:poly-gamma-glutamate synthesis protein (capsule biosynthesis protein)
MSGKARLLAVLLALAARSAQSQTPQAEARLLFTGDILVARQVAAEMSVRKTSPWADFAGEFRGAALVGGNFEGAIGTGCAQAAGQCFAAAESSAKLLCDAGFTLVTAENNHAGDLGADGRDRTRAVFQSAGLPAVDFEHSPVFMRAGAATVAIIAVSLIPAADGRVERIPSVALSQKLRTARLLANLVVVSIHWGNELQDWPSESQQEAARWLVAHGADLIVGHHPHVTQAAACVAGRPVFYSLGNHLFDQKYPETKQGLIADCRIADGRLHCGALRTETPRGSSYPALAGRDHSSDEALAACAPTLGPDLDVNETTIKPAIWRADAPPEGIVLEGWRNGALAWRSRRQQLLSLQFTRTLASEPLLFAIEKHPSSIDNETGPRPYVYAVGPSGLIARWRGSALAWPLIDAVESGTGAICALHRGDSFLLPDAANPATRLAAYRWNGFGFAGIPTPPECHQAFDIRR